MLKLCHELQTVVHKEPRDISGRPLVNTLLDSYRNRAIVPDHLLAGIGKWLLEYGFLQIRECSILMLLDSFPGSLLGKTSLGTQQEHFSKRKKTIKSITISTSLFLVALVSSVLRIANIDAGRKQISLLVRFSTLVAKTCWWLQFHIYGK